MFKVLDDDSISSRPVRRALYLSISLHLTLILAFSWFDAGRPPALSFGVMPVYAVSENAESTPALYLPISAQPKIVTERPSAIARPALNDRQAGFVPTEVPAEIQALLKEDAAAASPFLSTDAAGNLPVRNAILHSESSNPSPPAPPPPPAAKLEEPEPEGPAKSKEEEPIRVGGRVVPASILKKTVPVYPPLALKARVEGQVTIAATIDVDGRLRNLRVVSGHPLLIDAAMESVKSWRYRPTTLNEQPISVETVIQVNFALTRSRR
jgi:TonB family protein